MDNSDADALLLCLQIIFDFRISKEKNPIESDRFKPLLPANRRSGGPRYRFAQNVATVLFIFFFSLIYAIRRERKK